MYTFLNMLGFFLLGIALPTGFGWQFWLGLGAGILISLTSLVKGREEAKQVAKSYKKNW